MITLPIQVNFSTTNVIQTQKFTNLAYVYAANDEFTPLDAA